MCTSSFSSSSSPSSSSSSSPSSSSSSSQAPPPFARQLASLLPIIGITAAAAYDRPYGLRPCRTGIASFLLPRRGFRLGTVGAGRLQKGRCSLTMPRRKLATTARKKNNVNHPFDIFGEAPSEEELEQTSKSLEESAAVLMSKTEKETKAGESDADAPLEQADVLCVLSRFEAEALLQLKDGQRRRSLTVNLGTTPVASHSVTKAGIELTLDEEVHTIDWPSLEQMAKKGKQNAYQYPKGKGRPRKISMFSETTKRPLTLMPSEDFNPNKEGLRSPTEQYPPTLVIGGFTMHRIKNANPYADTLEKISSFPKGSLKGNVLDICTGLGYTASEMARRSSVDSVLTLELDPSVLEICKRNPWSQILFSSSKISTQVGNAAEILPTLQDEQFNVICHDPPAQALTFAGELYSQEFYCQLYRVLRRGGNLFHYVGNPDSREAGTLFSGVMRRLQDAGFKNVRKAPKAFGITASK